MTTPTPSGTAPTPRTADGLYFEVSGSGTAVVLIHGYPLDHTAMSDIAELIAGSHRIVNPDLRGFGRSAPALDGDLSMERHADDIAAIMDAEGIDSAAIVGLSMGGYVALAFAERHRSRVAGLGLIGAKTEPDTPEGRAGRDAQAAQILEHGRSSIVQGLTGALLAPGAPPMLRGRLRTMIEETRYETYVAALAGMRDRPDRQDVVAGLDVPVAVVVGAHDPLVPADMASHIAEGARAGSVTVVPDAGHLVTMERPGAVVGGLASVLTA
jgi:pimeloyl-ACP methyl ester carboxylesterase